MFRQDQLDGWWVPEGSARQALAGEAKRLGCAAVKLSDPQWPQIQKKSLGRDQGQWVWTKSFPTRATDSRRKVPWALCRTCPVLWACHREDSGLI